MHTRLEHSPDKVSCVFKHQCKFLIDQPRSPRATEKQLSTYRILEASQEGRLSMFGARNKQVNKIFSVVGFHCMFLLPKSFWCNSKGFLSSKAFFHLGPFGTTANLVWKTMIYFFCNQNTPDTQQTDNFSRPHSSHLWPHSDFNGLFCTALHHFFGPQCPCQTFSQKPRGAQLNTMPWVN